MESHPFPSRRSPLLGTILWTPLLAGLAMSALVGAWVAFGLLAVTGGFVGLVWYGIVYEIRGGTLEVRVGPIRLPPRNLAALRSVRSTRTPVAAPANSFDRLELDFGVEGVLIVSPADRSRFLEELRAHAPSAEFDL